MAQTATADYSLTGANAARAVEKGLAEADWYTCPVPKAEMRKLLERRDGPAIRDTLLWFALLVGFGVWGYCVVGQCLGRHPLPALRRALRLDLRFPLARSEPRHGVQDRLDEQRPVRDRLVHGHARVDRLALEPHPPSQRHDHRRPRPGDRRAAPPSMLQVHRSASSACPPAMDYFKTVLLHCTGRLTRRRRGPSFPHRNMARSSGGRGSTR